MTCPYNNIINTTAAAVEANELVLTIPAGTYNNCSVYNVRIAQPIPATAGANTPVVVQIGTETTYNNIVRKCGHFLYANQVTSGQIYALKVAADAGTFLFLNRCPLVYNPGAVNGLPTT